LGNLVHPREHVLPPFLTGEALSEASAENNVRVVVLREPIIRGTNDVIHVMQTQGC
jgi:hypothetical protein